jgi:glyceraldehyde 3-phosphate dehydrogenase (phosphorylating)
MAIRIGLMGFGRIGRNLFRILHERDDLGIEVISDIAEPASLEYLLRYDTVHGRFADPVAIRDGFLFWRNRKARVVAGREPGDVPWGDLGVDVVVEATARYRHRTEIERHLKAGAKRVILCVPPAEPPDITVVVGVNDALLRPEHRIVSNASCTAHCAGPLLKVLHESFGIRRAMLTTVHAYTSRDRLADVPDDDLRRGRAAAENIIPTSTNAVAMLQELIPALAGRLEGMALNVPVPDGSVVDLVCWTERGTTREAVNEAVRAAAVGPLRGILEYQADPIVSSDVIGNPHSSVFDAQSTLVLGGDLVKIVSWYDNGWGYASRVVDLIERFARMEGAS